MDTQVATTRRALSRLLRFTNQVLREQMSCGPVTMQQCTVLEVLSGGAHTMGGLAAQVAIHQSTLTRIVAKLERQGLVCRERPPDNQRTVVVQITDPGRQLFGMLGAEAARVVAALRGLVPVGERAAVVDAIVLLSDQLNPTDPRFQKVLKGCCAAVPVEAR